MTASETHEQSLGGPNNPTYHYGEEFVKVLLNSHWGGGTQQPGGTNMVCAMKDVGKCNPSRVTQGRCQNIPEALAESLLDIFGSRNNVATTNNWGPN